MALAIQAPRLCLGELGHRILECMLRTPEVAERSDLAEPKQREVTSWPSDASAIPAALLAGTGATPPAVYSYLITHTASGVLLIQNDFVTQKHPAKEFFHRKFFTTAFLDCFVFFSNYLRLP
jgi:hypothetical protein